MYKVQFQDFRCFGNSSTVEIKPITFLVGEHSAGKTSFLSGVRFLLESFSRRTQNPFNRDPYFLGGFEQIAPYRGGRGGRAKNFSLALECVIPSVTRGLGQGQRAASTTLIRHTFKFTKGYPQPELESYRFSSDRASILFVLKDEQAAIMLQHVGKPAEPLLGERSIPPSAIIKENFTFINYVLDELRGLQIHGLDRPDSDAAETGSLGTERTDLDALMRAFRQSSTLLSQNVFASAPVRTQPFRTYTPSEIISSSEGSHVPLELARTKRRSAEEWKSFAQHWTSVGWSDACGTLLG